MPVKSQPLRGIDIVHAVVDEQRVRRINIVALQQDAEECLIGLLLALEAGDDNAFEEVEEIELVARVRSGFDRPIAQGEQRSAFGFERA